MVCNLVSEACDDYSVKSFLWAINFEVIGGHHSVLISLPCSYGWNKDRYKLNCVFSLYVRRDTV